MSFPVCVHLGVVNSGCWELFSIRKRAGGGILVGRPAMDDQALLQRITCDPAILGGKPVVRGRRLAVAHVLGMLAVGDDIATVLEGYPWLEKEDVLACLLVARKATMH